MSHSAQEKWDRRTVLKWISAASASIWALEQRSMGQQPVPAAVEIPGIGTDPDLIQPVVPWARSLTPEQLRTLRVLCDLIIPADDRSPSAGSLGVHEFVDEWISAPYPDHQADQRLILAFLAQLQQKTAGKHPGKTFSDLTVAQQAELIDPVSNPGTAPASDSELARGFDRLRILVTGAFYTTPEGMADIQYIGNVPLGEFAGPPPEALRRLGLDPD